MPAIKTAISIDKALFKKVETMAVKYHISKSQVFSQAVEYVIKKDEGIELINRINSSISADQGADVNFPKQAKKLYSKTLSDKW